jgi:hypothetical protein
MVDVTIAVLRRLISMREHQLECSTTDEDRAERNRALDVLRCELRNAVKSGPHWVDWSEDFVIV